MVPQVIARGPRVRLIGHSYGGAVALNAAAALAKRGFDVEVWRYIRPGCAGQMCWADKKTTLARSGGSFNGPLSLC